MKALEVPSIDAILFARRLLAGKILRTPLVRCDVLPGDFGDHTDGNKAEIYLKLENLQPTGSFKVRGAGNALLLLAKSQHDGGVWTASAGNMGQALAWHARRLGIHCTVVVPDDAPEVKIHAIERLGADILRVPFAEYQSIQREGKHPKMTGTLIHPFADEYVLAGNGTIGLEILEDLPDVERVYVPYGGGGLSCGIAAAIKARKPTVRIVAVEVETSTPLTSSLSASKPVQVPYKSSFISGMGAPFIFPRMWSLASQLLDDSQVITLAQVTEGIRKLAAHHHIIAEGAGAAALAAAFARPAAGKSVCIISGGNIESEHLIKILSGGIP